MAVYVREIKLKDGGVSFSIDVYHKGRRRMVKTKIQTSRPTGREYLKAKRDAETMANEYEDRLKVDPDRVFNGDEKQCDDFLDYFKKMVDVKKNASSYRNAFKHLQDFNGKRLLPVSSITQVWAEGFRAYIDSLPIKETTKKNYFLSLKVILNEATRENLIPDFARKLKTFKKNDVALKYLTIDQIKTLEMTPCKNPAIRAAFLFACFTGLRVSDLMALQDSDIQHDGERLTIRYKMQKNQKYQVLTLGAQAIKYLNEARALHEFRQPEDNRVFMLQTNSGCLKILHRWGEAASIPFSLGFHCARHSFAVLSLQNGVDLYTVSKLLGHADIVTTQVYAKVMDSAKTAAMDKLPSW